MAFIPGQIIVCVKPFLLNPKKYTVPEVGKSYTVKEGHFNGVDLEEIPRHQKGNDISFNPSYFQKRPPNYVFTDEQIKRLILHW